MKYSLTPLALAVSLAHAQPCTTWVYQGAPLTVTETPGSQLGVSPLSGTITLSAPLSPNAVNATVTPLSWNFSAELSTLVPNGGYTTASTSFSTDANGNITGWNVQIWYNAPAGISFSNGFNSTPSGDTVEIVDNEGSSLETIVGQSTAPGAWACLPDPLQAQLTAAQNTDTALTAQVAALQAQVTALTAQLATMTTQRNSYLNGYLEENTAVLELRSEVEDLYGAYVYWADQARALTVQINALNAEIAALKAQLK